MSILVIDAATATGWAFREASGVIRHGSFAIKPPSSDRHAGERFFQFQALVADLVTEFEPRLVVVEQPFVNVKRPGSNRLPGTLANLVQFVAYVRNVPCVEVPNKLWKVFVHGRGDVGKEDTVALMKERGFPVGDDDNQADALGILEWSEVFFAAALAGKIPVAFWPEFPESKAAATKRRKKEKAKADKPAKVAKRRPRQRLNVSQAALFGE
jgi:Holliday junction resolvasome RuvABC endonuclease subunit